MWTLKNEDRKLLLKAIELIKKENVAKPIRANGDILPVLKLKVADDYASIVKDGTRCIEVYEQFGYCTL